MVFYNWFFISAINYEKFGYVIAALLCLLVEITLKLMFYVAYFLNQVELGQGTTATGMKSSLYQFVF